MNIFFFKSSDHSFPSKLSLIKIKDHYFSLITKICPERGLDAQDYACAECRKPLQFGKFLFSARNSIKIIFTLN